MDSSTCISCMEVLTSHLNFVTTCEKTEEILKVYRKLLQRETVINLRNVLKFLGKAVPYNSIYVKEEHTFNGTENRNKVLDVKDETCVNTPNSSEKSRGKNVKIFKCHLCKHETKYKRGLKMHLLIHKDISEVETYKCEMCEYQTKYRGDLKKHLLVHKGISEVRMYKCGTCEYQTKHGGAFKTHVLNHMDISEVQMYNCEICEYQTRHRRDFRIHLLVHKDTSEVRMFKCEACIYQTRYRRSFTRHLLVHSRSGRIGKELGV